MDLRHTLMATPLYDWLGKRTYAQSGEDVIAWQISGAARSAPTAGFYVDVGAYHPKLFSNTYLFYKKGWSGICVEPNPEIAGLFKWVRPRDVFLNLGVGGGKRTQELKNSRNQELQMEYYQFEDGAANTFSVAQAKKNQEEAGRKLLRTTKVPVRSLKSILDKNLPKGRKIDLMSVDVEGMDEEVLRSNDWKKYRPTIIIAEDLGFEFGRPKKSKVVNFLQGVGYRLVAKTPYSLIFRVVK